MGVATDSVVADYAAVGQRMRDHVDEQLLLVADPIERGFLAESFSARPESMRSALGHLDARYGGVESYLLCGGLASVQAGALRSRLVG